MILMIQADIVMEPIVIPRQMTERVSHKNMRDFSTPGLLYYHVMPTF